MILKNNQIKTFIKIDGLSIVFGLLFFLSQYLLGSAITIWQSVFAGIVFWVLTLFVAGFMGLFKIN
jgi:uncharacterized membrane protein YagU involved in acid resistance